jgi:hypothetical protein
MYFYYIIMTIYIFVFTNIYSHIYSTKLQLFTTIFFSQVKVFPKVSNMHLYIKQNKVKQEFFKKFTFHMVSHVI